MKRMLVLFKNDLRSISRDKNQLTFLLTPILLLLFINEAVPSLSIRFEILNEYKGLILMFGVVQTAILYGFVSAFALLNEKDENVLDAIRVLPVSPSFYLRYRVVFSYVVTFLGALLLLLTNKLVAVSISNALFLSVLFSLLAPFITFTIAALARNKVEGMAYFKGLDLLLLMPVLAIALGGVWHYILFPIPSYWAYRCFDVLLLHQMSIQWQMVFYVIAMIYFFLILTFVLRLYKKRVYDVL